MKLFSLGLISVFVTAVMATESGVVKLQLAAGEKAAIEKRVVREVIKVVGRIGTANMKVDWTSDAYKCMIVGDTQSTDPAEMLWMCQLDVIAEDIGAKVSVIKTYKGYDVEVLTIDAE